MIICTRPIILDGQAARAIVQQLEAAAAFWARIQEQQPEHAEYYAAKQAEAERLAGELGSAAVRSLSLLEDPD